MVREREYNGLPGLPVAIGLLGLLAALAWIFVEVVRGSGPPLAIVVISVGWVLTLLLLVGLFMVNPNEGKVLQLFGEYVGTARHQGLRWANPFFTKKSVSLRIRNFESSRLKVNDNEGNPIEIAAVVVWKVVDTAEAIFEVDDYENYVHV
jgi:regulator of protease activity HflC (stomatin/prohibitin superfamily)